MKGPWRSNARPTEVQADGTQQNDTRLQSNCRLLDRNPDADPRTDRLEVVWVALRELNLNCHIMEIYIYIQPRI